jgi:hypothetical protein
MAGVGLGERPVVFKTKDELSQMDVENRESLTNDKSVRCPLIRDRVFNC